jgi:hypothetical protein
VPEACLRIKFQRQSAVVAWITKTHSIYDRTFHHQDAPNFITSKMKKSADNVGNRLPKYSRKIMHIQKTRTHFLAPSQAVMISRLQLLDLIVRLTLLRCLTCHLLISTTQILYLLLDQQLLLILEASGAVFLTNLWIRILSLHIEQGRPLIPSLWPL